MPSKASETGSGTALSENAPLPVVLAPTVEMTVSKEEAPPVPVAGARLVGSREVESAHRFVDSAGLNKAEINRETIEQPKRASGRSFASVVTRKRPSLNHALISTAVLTQNTV